MRTMDVHEHQVDKQVIKQKTKIRKQELFKTVKLFTSVNGQLLDGIFNAVIINFSLPVFIMKIENHCQK